MSIPLTIVLFIIVTFSAMLIIRDVGSSWVRTFVLSRGLVCAYIPTNVCNS